VGGAIAADRFTYLPVIGIGFLVAESAAWLLKVKFRDGRAARGLFWAGIVVLAAVMVFMTRAVARSSVRAGLPGRPRFHAVA